MRLSTVTIFAFIAFTVAYPIPTGTFDLEVRQNKGSASASSVCLLFPCSLPF